MIIFLFQKAFLYSASWNGKTRKYLIGVGFIVIPTFLSSLVIQSMITKKNSIFRACQAVSDDALQGVCYTKQECDDLGGTEDGNCAAGFGTCCVIT